MCREKREMEGTPEMNNGAAGQLASSCKIRLIAARFHNTLVESIVEVAKLCGEERIVLTGGCFQNRYLTERAVRRLREERFRPYWHQRIPPNDGGIALGQLWALLRERKAAPCASAFQEK